MRRRHLMALGAVAVMAVAAGPGASPAVPVVGQARQPAGEPLRVATKPIAPFVFYDSTDPNEPPSGFSIDLWNRIATELDRPTTWVRHQKVSEVVDAVASSEVDVGVAAISMTAEREDRLDFTHPFFDSGLQVMVSTKGGRTSFFQAFSWVTTRSFLIALVLFFLLVVLFGHMIWLIERRDNEDFPDGYRRGIFHGMFWALAVITGGDSEKSVSKPVGRLIFAIWLLFGIFLVAYVTGLVTTDLTVTSLQNSIESVDDIAGKRVLCVPNTVAADFLDARGIRYEAVDTIEDAVDAVADQRADAAVYDSPVLVYAAATRASGKVEVVGPIFRPDKYAIALPTGSALREQINDVILRLQADGTLDDLYRKWFQAD